MDSSYRVLWVWSGTTIMMMSAAAAASAAVITLRPSASAFAQDLLPSYRPTTTLQPLSFRLRAWAWPWLP